MAKNSLKFLEIACEIFSEVCCSVWKYNRKLRTDFLGSDFDVTKIVSRINSNM